MNVYVSITTVSIATKLDRVVTYNKLSPIKSQDSSITRSCEIKGTTKNIITLNLLKELKCV